MIHQIRAEALHQSRTRLAKALRANGGHRVRRLRRTDDSRNYEDLRRAAFLALAAGTLAEARASLTAALERELKEV